MDFCGIHQQLNNKYGYCPGCEKDKNIRIKKCEKCNQPYAEHVNNDNTSNLCPSCLLGY